jgi:hypothetical protein
MFVTLPLLFIPYAFKFTVVTEMTSDQKLFPSSPTNPNAHKIGLASVVAIAFYTVSGGPYGLEQIVQAGGMQNVIEMITVST